MPDKSPIALFVYNRPDHTRKTLKALSENEEASAHSLYIFADGAKKEASPEQRQKISEVRNIIREQNWAKETLIFEGEVNKGLAGNISSGIAEVLKSHKTVIVLEDDIVSSSAFLKYMDRALDLYKDEKKVMHISGYSLPVKYPESYPHESYFFRVPHSWGWATWRDRWHLFNNDADMLWKAVRQKRLLREFDLEDSNDFHTQLLLNKKGKIKTWAVQWYAVMLLNKGLALCPVNSLVQNIGNDGSGENSRDVDLFLHKKLEKEIRLQKIPVSENPEVLEAIRLYFKRNVGKSRLKLLLQRKLDELLG